MNFPLNVSPKEMGDHTRQRKQSTITAGIERKTSGFDRPLPYQLGNEARREEVVDDYGENCGNMNVKGTNECCAASTEDPNDGSEN